MVFVCGSLEELSEGTYHWNLEKTTVSKENIYSYFSKEFTVYDNHKKEKYNFRFRLNRYNYAGNLWLCASRELTFMLDVYIEMHYENKYKELSFKDLLLTKYNNVLTNFNFPCKLIGVTCTVSNIRVTSKNINISDVKGDITEQPGSSRLNQDIVTINPEVKEPPKMKGLLALSKSFEDIFLNEDESDLIFNVGDKKYPAHKVIIRARSPVFYAMLKNDMREKNEGSVDISDCDPYVFKHFLLYLYTGKFDDISNVNICELYYMSDKYDVKELKTDCVEYISRNLSVDLICDVISLATKHCEHDLLSQATDFFSENAKAILQTVNWQNFVKENPVEANELFIKAFNKISEK